MAKSGDEVVPTPVVVRLFLVGEACLLLDPDGPANQPALPGTRSQTTARTTTAISKEFGVT